MLDLRTHPGLLRVFGEAQRVGALGPVSPADVIDHSLGFVEALPADATTCADLGTGAGVPGLVIAIARPDLRLVLVDRRAKRTDVLQRAVTSLGLDGRVEVVCGDVDQLGRSTFRHSMDAVTCRGFGSPATTISLSTPWVRTGGVVIVSEPPEDRGDRWAGVDLAAADTSNPVRKGSVAVFHVEHSGR